MSVIDQSQDLNGQELFRLISLYGAPAFVKEAATVDLCGDSDKPNTDYADPYSRQWYLGTPAAVWASAGFLMTKRADIDKKVFERSWAQVEKTASYFGVREEIAQLQEKVAKAGDYSLEDLPDSDFAVVFVDVAGQKQRKVPLRNALETKVAADYLQRHRDELPFNVCRHMADKIMYKAAEYGSDLRKHVVLLEKLAGNGLCAASDAAGMLRQRTRMIGRARVNDPVCDEMEKLAALIEANPKGATPDFLMDVAELVDEFDYHHKLNRQYGEGVERPEDVLFAVTKTAAAELSQDLAENAMTGNFYKRADLERLRVRDIAGVMGEEFAKAVSTAGVYVDTEKLATVLPTLPLNDAEVFDQLAAETGIVPLPTKQAGYEVKLNLQQLAKEYSPPASSMWAQVPSARQ